tara:strand:- start:656 stop:823 length:168 start_codon:yes stop_codon:yes gene_type:complete
MNRMNEPISTKSMNGCGTLGVIITTGAEQMGRGMNHPSLHFLVKIKTNTLCDEHG